MREGLWSWSFVWLVALAIGGCSSGDDVATGGSETSTGGSTTGSTSDASTSQSSTIGPTETGGPTDPSDPTDPSFPCGVSEDCPEFSCRVGSCVANVCAYVPAPEGTPLQDTPGDCRLTVCDGLGAPKEIAHEDPPGDVAGDCKRATCEAGEITYVADDDDLPTDDKECTADSCSAGTPTFTNKPINTFCGPMGAHFCHEDAVCRRCKVIDACDDPGPEPHETQETAFNLGKIGDNDGTGSYRCSSLSSPGDVDWYTYLGDDTIFGVVDPTRVIDPSQGARLCVYAQCTSGTTWLSCGAGLTSDTSPLGHAGCCGYGKVAPKLECSGTDDDARVWIRVDQPAETCVAYDLDYHY